MVIWIDNETKIIKCIDNIGNLPHQENCFSIFLEKLPFELSDFEYQKYNPETKGFEYIENYLEIKQQKIDSEEKEKQIREAKKYLEETDWIIVKMAEENIKDKDITGDKTKYKDILDLRQEKRDLINQLESEA